LGRDGERLPLREGWDGYSEAGMGLLIAIKHRKICKYKIKIISCTPKPKIIPK
jgi:hypothetical protein